MRTPGKFLSPLAALAVAFFAMAQSSLVFFIEAFAVWMFAEQLRRMSGPSPR